jgi:hypothetical protein
MEAGIVDKQHKEFDPGITVATMLMGTSQLYRFAHRNPAITPRPAGIGLGSAVYEFRGLFRTSAARRHERSAESGFQFMGVESNGMHPPAATDVNYHPRKLTRHSKVLANLFPVRH